MPEPMPDHLNLTKLPSTFEGTVQLPSSKSESNRALILQALSAGRISIENLSEAADTVTLHRLLKQSQAISDTTVLNVGPAGTAMRFLTAYLCLQQGSFTLTGSERMKQRPIGILVEALRDLGADIRYLEEEGFPPLEIHGPIQQKSAQVRVKGNISSQYITALLLIAGQLPLGLELSIKGELTSKPYIDMTLAMLSEAGIEYDWKGDTLSIKPQQLNPCTLSIESDWSAASYWFSFVALSEQAELHLPGLKAKSLQGDRAIIDFMNSLGVHTTQDAQGLTLRKSKMVASDLHLDSKNLRTWHKR